MPSPLWPQVWRWLQTWVKEWSGYLVLASGSLPSFWELKEFVSEPVTVPHLLPDGLRARLIAAEDERGLDRESTWMIGDRSFDIEAARANQVRSLAAGWGYGSPEEWAQADAVAASPADVLALVAQPVR
jgi:hypothetical protein